MFRNDSLAQVADNVELLLAELNELRFFTLAL
jgi:hypothetical protein